MSGAQLYGPQLVETNPPLIIWFSTILVFLARLFHPDSLLMLKLVVLVMILGSLLWCDRILRSARLLTSRAAHYLALSSILAAEIFLHGFEIGQREHLFVILLVPYVLLASCSGRVKLPLAERCAIGLIAGIGRSGPNV